MASGPVPRPAAVGGRNASADLVPTAEQAATVSRALRRQNEPGKERRRG